jgi:predicted tellurium resistance membrane protein TerC
MLENLMTLLMLIALQAVLGFDNLLYISLESKRAPEDKQSMVRKWGIGLAIVLRMALLFILVHAMPYFQEIVWSPANDFFNGQFNWHSFIVLGGGIFIIYTAMKEIFHMVNIEEHEKEATSKKTNSIYKTIGMIVIMNVVFSFDSILSAMALTDIFWIMATAILASGLLMIWMADKVSDFLKKNRMYEVLGLFILFVVGIMLLTEGAHIANLEILGEHISVMSKTTFYFVIAIVVLNDIVQGFYQKKLKGK